MERVASTQKPPSQAKYRKLAILTTTKTVFKAVETTFAGTGALLTPSFRSSK
uniref:Uncharacterized protein n=1 Tax=Setaria italica TaxID=4555 RepID=K3ZBT2_SETIT